MQTSKKSKSTCTRQHVVRMSVIHTPCVECVVGWKCHLLALTVCRPCHAHMRKYQAFPKFISFDVCS